MQRNLAQAGAQPSAGAMVDGGDLARRDSGGTMTTSPFGTRTTRSLLAEVAAFRVAMARSNRLATATPNPDFYYDFYYGELYELVRRAMAAPDPDVYYGELYELIRERENEENGSFHGSRPPRENEVYDRVRRWQNENGSDDCDENMIEVD